jgi:putative restriction endonuclease
MTKPKNTTFYWALKSVADKDVTYKSTNGYKDEIETKYVYDDAVANHKQIKSGDIAVIIDKKKVLGLAKILEVVEFKGKKERRRCPICRSTNYEARITKTPEYRCNKGHEFAAPDSEEIEVKKYEAYYSSSFILPKELVTIDKLKPFYHNGYNRNMSMQNISEDFFAKYYEVEMNVLKENFIYPSAEESENYLGDVIEDNYVPTNKDERPKIFQAIYARRGQQKFRDSLRELYGDKCMITGCEILDVIEAAHINPYRGEKDNDATNGLLLRSDIHTLFDLDLIGIEPKEMKVHLNEAIKKEGYEILQNKFLIVGGKKPSQDALEIRWQKFLKK